MLPLYWAISVSGAMAEGNNRTIVSRTRLQLRKQTGQGCQGMSILVPPGKYLPAPAGRVGEGVSRGRSGWNKAQTQISGLMAPDWSTEWPQVSMALCRKATLLPVEGARRASQMSRCWSAPDGRAGVCLRMEFHSTSRSRLRVRSGLGCFLHVVSGRLEKGGACATSPNPCGMVPPNAQLDLGCR